MAITQGKTNLWIHLRDTRSAAVFSTLLEGEDLGGRFNVSYEHWTGSGRTDTEYIHHVALVAGEDPGAIMAMLETFDCFSRLLFRYSTAVAARTSTNGTQRVPKYHISISFT